jgi:hypothetical protein
LLCFWYSATAISEDKRISQKVKFGLFAYLVIVLLVVLTLHESGEDQGGKTDWPLHPALKAMGVGK